MLPSLQLTAYRTSENDPFASSLLRSMDRIHMPKFRGGVVEVLGFSHRVHELARQAKIRNGLHGKARAPAR